jgi:hypothetical protein
MRISIGLFVSAMVISALLHVGALLFGVWAGYAQPFDPRPLETVTVSIVRPDETLGPEPAKPPPGKTAPAEATPQPPKTAPNQSPFDPSKLAAMFPVSPVGGSGERNPMTDANTQANGFDAPAEKTANLSAADIAALKAHVRKCAALPAGMSAAEKLRIVVRLSLKPDGGLKARPMLLEASASRYGPALAQSVMAALNQCQPYNLFPADKYAEWQVLDISFSPRDLGG